MSRKTIIILIVIAAIFVIIAFTTTKKEPSIEEAYINDNNNLSEKELGEIDSKNKLYDTKSNIYLIVFVKNLTKENELKITWKKIDNGMEKIIQENLLKPENDGSGKIIISLIRKNQVYTPGTYRVGILLNGLKETDVEFKIK
jgi:hypothetical protein